MRTTTKNFFASMLLAVASTSTVIGASLAYPAPGAATAAELKSAGEFRGADRSHPASGGVEIVRLKGGGLGVKFAEDFQSRGGPDLRIWLSEARNPTNGRTVRAARHIDLDGLKSTSGEQIYRIPENVDIEDFNSVVIWCRAFGVFFGAANLS